VLVRGCPGATGGSCPYRSVTIISRRGEGVLRCPEALAFAPDGDLYVADQFSHLVQRFSPAGRFLGQWGTYGAGPGELGAIDGLAVAANGDVYVLDSTHDRIERFTPGGRLLSEWGGPGRALGEFDFGPGYGPDKPPGGGIAVGGGYVYVSDSANNRIVRFDLDGSHPVLWAGPGSALGEVSSPRGLAVAGGVVYVADEGNHRIQAFTLAGRPLYAEGTFGKEPGQFVNPFAVTVSGGHVYAVDDNNNRIVVLTPTLHYLEEWSGEGAFHLSYIRAAAASPSGRIYVADTGHERVVAFTAAGRGLLAFGTPGTSPGQLIAPLGVAATRAGGAFVVETYGSRSPIYRFDAALRYRGEWQRGGGAIVGTHWFGPTAAAVAPDGSLWVTDPRNGIVRHLSSEGSYLGALGDPSPPGNSADGGSTDGGSTNGGSTNGGSTNGGSTNGGSTNGGSTDAVVGTRVGASSATTDQTGSVPRASTGDSSAATSALLEPEGVALSPSGSIVYVADTGAGQIMRFSASYQPLGRLGSVAFTRPVAVAVAPNGTVYVADAGLDRIFALSPSGTLLASWGGPGHGLGRFEQPAGIAVDTAGDVFVSDRLLDRIQKFSPRGHLLAAWGAPGGAPGQLSAPAGLAADCLGRLLVADTANNRVVAFAGAAARGRCVPDHSG
jgi:tripartite motif-containing protein 71